MHSIDSETPNLSSLTEPLIFDDGATSPSFNTILASTDFSDISKHALREAVRLCKAAKGQLLLLHVSEYGPVQAASSEIIESGSQVTRDEIARLDCLLKEIREQGVSAEPIVEYGLAAGTILKVIDDRKVDLAILGTHGVSGMERMVFGSTAEAVLREALCPVLTVGPQVAARKDTDKRGPIVFATDFHRPSTDAVRHAVALARLTDTTLHCLHVLPLSMEKEGQAPIVHQIMLGLKHLVAEQQDAKEPICTVAYGSEVSHAVTDYAKAQQAEAIVLGVRRTTWATAHVPPHVTYRIIITAPCPVLTMSFGPHA